MQEIEENLRKEKENIIKIEGRLEDSPEDKKAYYIGRLAGTYSSIGYFCLIIGDEEESCNNFDKSAAQYLRQHQYKISTGDDDQITHNPKAIRYALLYGILGKSDQTVENAVEAIESLRQPSLDDESLPLTHYYRTIVISSLVDNTVGSITRLDNLKRAVEQHDQSDIPYDYLVDAYQAIREHDYESLERALTAIQEFHESKYKKTKNLVKQHLCEQLVQTIALADYCGLGVDTTFEYAPGLPYDI